MFNKLIANPKPLLHLYWLLLVCLDNKVVDVATIIGDSAAVKTYINGWCARKCVATRVADAGTNNSIVYYIKCLTRTSGLIAQYENEKMQRSVKAIPKVKMQKI